MRRLRFACAVLVAVLVVPSLACAASATAAEYRERVATARAAVEEALPGVADEAAAHDLAEEVGALLPAHEQVTLGGGDVSVDNSALHTLLGQMDDAGSADGRRRSAESILAHLDSQQVALGTTGTAPPHDEAALERILKDEGVTKADPQNKLLAEIQKLVDKLLAWLTAAGERPAVKASFRVAYYALLVLSGFAVIWIAWLVIRRLRASGLRGDSSGGAADDAPVVAAAEGLPDDALAFADAEAANGRFREAVRALFGGAARELVVRGVVPRTRTRTTRELLGDVGDSRPHVLPPLRLLADAFEPAWYGHVDPGSPGYADARAVYVSLTGALDSAGEAS